MKPVRIIDLVWANKLRFFVVSYVIMHIILAILIGNSVILAPDEGGYLYTFQNLYGSSDDLNPQWSSGWIAAPKIFLFLLYSPAKLLTMLGLSDLLAIRFLSIAVTFIIIYGIIFLGSKSASRKLDSVVAISIGVFFIPSIFLWTTIGLRESFILWALFICFFGIWRYLTQSSLLNLTIITFGFYSLLSIKSYLWAGASLALSSLVFLCFIKRISRKRLFLILLSAVVLPAVIFSATSTPYSLNFIIHPDLSSASNRSGDSITVVYLDSVSGKLKQQRSSASDIRVEFHGDYSVLSMDNFINTNPASVQTWLMVKLGIKNQIREYLNSKIDTIVTPPLAPTLTCVANVFCKEIASTSKHIIKPGNLKNPASLIKPSLLFVFGNAPLSQDDDSLPRAIASAESPLWWLFYFLVIFSLISYRKAKWLNNPVLIYSMVLTIVYTVLSALTEVNFGTAFRHRSILVIPLIFIILATRVSFEDDDMKEDAHLKA